MELKSYLIVYGIIKQTDNLVIKPALFVIFPLQMNNIFSVTKSIFGNLVLLSVTFGSFILSTLQVWYGDLFRKISFLLEPKRLVSNQTLSRIAI